MPVSQRDTKQTTPNAETKVVSPARAEDTMAVTEKPKSMPNHLRVFLEAREMVIAVYVPTAIPSTFATSIIDPSFHSINVYRQS